MPALLAAFGSQAQAQSTGASTQVAPSERAKRDAEKVFQWIRLHGDKPRKAAVPAAPAAEKPAAVRVVAKPPARPADSGITETVTPLAAPMTRTAAGPSAAASSSSTATAAANPRASDNPLPAEASGVAAATSQPAPAIEEEDTPLRPVRQAEPEFPPSLMRQLRRGLVQVSFTVEPDGSVSHPKAVSSTHPRLAQTAVATVAQWKFQPLRHAQQGVVDLGFNLD